MTGESRINAYENALRVVCVTSLLRVIELERALEAKEETKRGLVSNRMDHAGCKVIATEYGTGHDDPYEVLLIEGDKRLVKITNRAGAVEVTVDGRVIEWYP